jgi:hypothetical protein
MVSSVYAVLIVCALRPFISFPVSSLALCLLVCIIRLVHSMALRADGADNTFAATQCVVPLVSAPFCADNSWLLWTAAVLEDTSNSKSAYFCCLPGQVGLQTGDCVASDAVVAASLSASLVRILTPSSLP